MLNYKTNNDNLNNLLKNKRVVFVGPSYHLINNDIGDLIDSYDIVCRSNVTNIPFHYENDYGCRTDILFHVLNNIPYEIEYFKKNVNKEKFSKIKLVVLSRDNSFDFKLSPEESYKKYIEGINNPPNFCYILPESYWEASKNLNGDINSGLTSILMLLSCEIKELFITGISFYHEMYKIPSYYPSHEYTDPNGVLIGNVHKQEHQKEFFKNNILKNFSKNVIIDSYLRDKVLKIKYDNCFTLGEK